MADGTDLVAQAFEAQRDRLRAVAYRMLGSHADAEDVVQEAWLRLARQDTAAIDNLAGWLTTVVGRISLDVLRSRQVHPEASYDDRPELVVTADEGPAPDETAALADSIGLALIVVLDSLAPSERLAFVLHDMFAVPFQEIGQILGKSTDAAKMLASRARRKVQQTERPATIGREQRSVVDAFRKAAHAGDFEALLRVLDPNVKRTVHSAAGETVILGATEVAAGAKSYRDTSVRQQAVVVGDRLGVLSWASDGSPMTLIAFTVTGDRITAIEIFTDPARLAAMSLPTASED